MKEKIIYENDQPKDIIIYGGRIGNSYDIYIQDDESNYKITHNDKEISDFDYCSCIGHVTITDIDSLKDLIETEFIKTDKNDNGFDSLEEYFEFGLDDPILVKNFVGKIEVKVGILDKNDNETIISAAELDGYELIMYDSYYENNGVDYNNTILNIKSENDVVIKRLTKEDLEGDSVKNSTENEEVEEVEKDEEDLNPDEFIDNREKLDNHIFCSFIREAVIENIKNGGKDERSFLETLQDLLKRHKLIEFELKETSKILLFDDNSITISGVGSVILKDGKWEIKNKASDSGNLFIVAFQLYDLSINFKNAPERLKELEEIHEKITNKKIDTSEYLEDSDIEDIEKIASDTIRINGKRVKAKLDKNAKKLSPVKKSELKELIEKETEGRFVLYKWENEEKTPKVFEGTKICGTNLDSDSPMIWIDDKSDLPFIVDLNSEGEFILDIIDEEEKYSLFIEETSVQVKVEEYIPESRDLREDIKFQDFINKLIIYDQDRFKLDNIAGEYTDESILENLNVMSDAGYIYSKRKYKNSDNELLDYFYTVTKKFLRIRKFGTVDEYVEKTASKN